MTCTADPVRSSAATIDQRLWYLQPAGSDWNAALPLGNGRLGAMVFGNVAHERIQLNEDTVWSGGLRQRLNPDARGALPEIRGLLAAGRIGEAETLAQRCLGGIPDSQLLYQPLADLWLDVAHPGLTGEVRDYRRELDLATAECRVTYRIGDVRFTRTHLASYPHGVIAVRLQADRPGAIAFAARLTRGTASHYAARYLDRIEQIDGEALVGSGRTGGEHGSSLAVAVRCRTHGGRVYLQGETLIVEDADEAWLTIAGATTFRHEEPAAVVRAATAAAQTAGWQVLSRAQREDHASLFAVTRLTLGPATAEVPGAAGTVSDRPGDLPTDQRVARLRAGGEDADLLRLFFDYGRYLLIASSRPGSLPANLQGRWCQEMEPPWGAKYTININTQMNYWPAEPCGLGACHEPLFDLIDRLVVTGTEVARRMYGCRGFVVHHNTDLVADACPTDRYLPASYWPMGGAWLSLHLWERCLFSGERRDQERAWPVLREASRFFVDFLVPDVRGDLVVSPSCSPENTYRLADGSSGTLCAGASMDSQILERLFTATVACAAGLEGLSAVEREFARTVDATRRRLPPPRIGEHGQLLEWADDHAEVEPGHRHVSHLFALHPGGAIDPIATPALAAAARISLERRLAAGGAGTGWSRAWTINFCGRLLDGDGAHQHLRHLVAHATLPNLFDDHPPFQIDGNFGACAGIVEMLVQSHRRDATGVTEVHLLPALPRAWPAGAVSGLRVRGGGAVDLAWHAGRLTTATLRGRPGSTWHLRRGDALETCTLPASGAWVLSGG